MGIVTSLAMTEHRTEGTVPPGPTRQTYDRSGSNVAIRTPVLLVVESTSLRGRFALPSRNRRFPLPRTMGLIESANRSTRSFSISVWTSSPLPRTTVLPRLLLELRDRLRDVALQQGRVQPLERLAQRGRGDVLRHAVQRCGERVVVWLRRPERCHALVCPPAKQEAAGPLHRFDGHLGEDVVEVRPLPSAVREPADPVLVRVPGACITPSRDRNSVTITLRIAILLPTDVLESVDGAAPSNSSGLGLTEPDELVGDVARGC